jgi:cob(I)alamin adenosyltransferase
MPQTAEARRPPAGNDTDQISEKILFSVDRGDRRIARLDLCRTSARTAETSRAMRALKTWSR